MKTKIVRLLLSEKAPARQIDGKDTDAAILASDWDKWMDDPTEVNPEIRPLADFTDAEVRILRWPDPETQLELVDPEYMASALLKALEQGTDLRNEATWSASGDVVDGRPYLDDLVISVRKVCDSCGLNPEDLLASVLGFGVNQDESAFPLACKMAAELDEAERLERCKPVETLICGEKWLTDGCACWIADGPQPTETEELLASQRDQLKNWNPEGQLHPGQSGFGRMIALRYHPLTVGCEMFTAMESDFYCLVYKAGKLVAVIAGLRE